MRLFFRHLRTILCIDFIFSSMAVRWIILIPLGSKLSFSTVVSTMSIWSIKQILSSLTLVLSDKNLRIKSLVSSKRYLPTKKYGWQVVWLLTISKTLWSTNNKARRRHNNFVSVILSEQCRLQNLSWFDLQKMIWNTKKNFTMSQTSFLSIMLLIHCFTKCRWNRQM